jgi:hypothetical protein
LRQADVGEEEEMMTEKYRIINAKQQYNWMVKYMSLGKAFNG